MEEVILVDENDKQIGTEEKIAAHTNPRLHRAFSVFTFNEQGNILLQKRADSKYHCPGLWANTCCSHPRPNELTVDAAERRLMEEMGFTTKLKEVFEFIYKAEFDNGLTEHEFDHIFFGKFNGKPEPNPEEVSEYRYMNFDELKEDINKHPDSYVPWLKKIIKEFSSYF